MELKLDKDTLEFAIKTAWQYEVTCKNTKEGRIKAEAFNSVKRTFEHFMQQLENSIE